MQNSEQFPNEVTSSSTNSLQETRELISLRKRDAALKEQNLKVGPMKRQHTSSSSNSNTEARSLISKKHIMNSAQPMTTITIRSDNEPTGTNDVIIEENVSGSNKSTPKKAKEIKSVIPGIQRQRSAWDGWDDVEEDSQQEFRKQFDDYDVEVSDSGSEDYEEKKLTLYQACGLNTMNMFGTGPFITIPFVVAAADPPGPQALFGYGLAAFACMNDSLVWSELGSMWPESGGSYVYLRELYGRNTWGRLIAFLFVWQIMVSGPMECASGFIATAQYVAYIDRTYSYLHHSLIAFAMCVATVWALYREIDEVGTITLVLWAFTIAAIIFAIAAGYSTFSYDFLKAPDNAFDDGGKFFISLGIAARFAVYDFTGYYDVNFVGTEVQNPRKNIPIACVTTCCVVAMIFFLVDIAVIGSLEWDPAKGGYVKLVQNESEAANYIMALFCETHISRGFAIFFSIIVAITIFGSCFSFMIGLAQIPYTAAKDGYFYEFLSHEHATYKGLQDYSLLFVGTLSTIFCFVDLKIVIEGMLTMQLLLQFMGQGWGLIWYRYFTPEENQEEAGFSVPLFPIPNIIQLIVFGFIFFTTETYIIHGGTPLLEVAMLFLLAGVIMYLLWAKKNSLWPFDKEFDVEWNEEHEHAVTVHDDFQQEIAVLKKKLVKLNQILIEWNHTHSGINKKLHEKDTQIDETVGKLGMTEYRIISYSRKIVDAERRVAELQIEISDKEKQLAETKHDNTKLSERIYEIQKWWGQTDDPVFRSTQIENESNSSHPSVTEWTVADVEHWWRVHLPRGAQPFIDIVSECQLTGPDLLQVDEEMLEQYGLMKVLIRKVLASIEELQAKANRAHQLHQAHQAEEIHPRPQMANPIKFIDTVERTSDHTQSSPIKKDPSRFVGRLGDSQDKQVSLLSANESSNESASNDQPEKNVNDTRI